MPAQAASQLQQRAQRLDVPGFQALPGGSGVGVTLYLNERWIPVRGFSSSHLLPTDRCMFSLVNGDGKFSAAPKGLMTPSENTIRLPSGWAWSGGWHDSVGNPEYDDEGFQVRLPLLGLSCMHTGELTLCALSEPSMRLCGTTPTAKRRARRTFYAAAVSNAPSREWASCHFLSRTFR